MKIAVAVKEVLDARVPIEPASATGEPVHPGGAIRLCNPSDRAAVEVALALRASSGGRVEAFSVCAAAEEGALRYALARGVDRAERLEPSSDAGGPVGTALALHRRLAGAGFDLVACGDATLDSASAVVGPLLAELLGWAQVTSVCEVRVASRETLVLVRKLEAGHREVVEARLPLVATFTADAARPRYVSQRLLDRARALPIEVCAAGGAAERPAVPAWPAGERRVPPRARVKKRFAPDPNLSPAERVKLIMAGGSQPHTAGSSASVLEGETGYLVEQLYRFLKHHEFV